MYVVFVRGQKGGGGEMVQVKQFDEPLLYAGKSWVHIYIIMMNSFYILYRPSACPSRSLELHSWLPS